MSQAPASRVRGTAVGALTAALAVAAHGYGGGGLPSSMDATLLLIAAGVVGAIVSETAVAGATWPARGRLPLLAALFGGQLFGHLILSAAASGHALAHPAAISWPMLLAHPLAAVVCAALIELVERLYGPLTALIRAATSYPSSSPTEPLVLTHHAAPRPSAGGVIGLHSISRRGPPVRV